MTAKPETTDDTDDKIAADAVRFVRDCSRILGDDHTDETIKMVAQKVAHEMRVALRRIRTRRNLGEPDWKSA